MDTYHAHLQASRENPTQFWLNQAKRIPWFQAPEQGLSTDEDGLQRWFAGGQINTCHVALDAHVEAGRGHEVALIYDSPVTQTIRRYTYSELLNEVSTLAGGLQKLGVHKGDRVVIYMPMIPQAVMAMLACARLGAIHSVVFGGFAPHELALRIDDGQPKVILTANSGIEIHRIIPHKPMVE